MAHADMLMWHPSCLPVPEERRKPKKHRNASTYDLMSWADRGDVTHEQLATQKTLKRTESYQRLLGRSESESSLIKRRMQTNELQRIWRAEGKLQERALNAPVRVRKDFRATPNRTSDIPGAEPAIRCGRTALGRAVDRETVWPYDGARAFDDRGLFESDGLSLPPKRSGRDAQIALELAGIPRETLYEVRSVGRCTFDERVYRSQAVECHLAVPGVALRAQRRVLDPLVEPTAAARLQTVPSWSLHDRPEQKTFAASQTSLALGQRPPRPIDDD